MSLQGALHHVLSSYASAAEAPFKGHPLASFIREDLEAEVKAIV